MVLKIGYDTVKL